MDTWWQDLRYGLRMLAKGRGSTALAIFALALGIGGSTSIFSLLNAVIFRPLPVEDPNRLAAFYSGSTKFPYGPSSYPNYVHFRDRNEVFSGLIAYFPISLHLRSTSQTERLRGEIVSGNYFSVLGVEPVRGRTFLPEEDQTPGTHPVAIVSHALWQRRFHSDRALVGGTVHLNGHPFTVVGIAPKGFKGITFRESSDVWVPLMMQTQVMPGSDRLTERRAVWLYGMGRLKPGVTLKQAQADVSVIARRLEEAYPESNQGLIAALLPERDARAVPGSRAREVLFGFMRLLMTVVSLVLLIACANVANLLLARGSARQREIAIRLALGARRTRLMRQLLTESVLLSLMGGVLGLLLALWIFDLLQVFRLPSGIPVVALDLSLDARVFGFALLLSLLTGVIFGLPPAFQASRVNLVPALKEGSSTDTFGRSWLRNLFVISQVAISLVLLIAAGLLVRSLRYMQAIDPGFEHENAMIMSLDLDLQGYSRKQGRVFYRQLMGRIEALPGIRSASLARFVPVSPDGMWGPAFIEEHNSVPDQQAYEIDINFVGPSYFRTIGIPLLRGREFNDQDTETAPRVVIINETMARHFWPDQDPIGRRLRIGSHRSSFRSVVGVARDAKYHSLREEPQSYVYLPIFQSYKGNTTLLVRTVGNPNAVLAAVRHEISALDKDLPTFNIMALSKHLGVALSKERMGATLLGILGLLALILAGVGIYGVISYSVTQRTHEIGIRMSLGAQPRDILRLVVGQGMFPALIGQAIGVAVAFALTRLMSTLLFGVSPTDPVTFAGILLLLTAAALLACYIPARRAAKVDPMVALHYE